MNSQDSKSLKSLHLYVQPIFTLYHCYSQSLDQDNLWIVLRKPWIRALHRQSVDCPSTHPHNIGCGHVYAD